MPRGNGSGTGRPGNGIGRGLGRAGRKGQGRMGGTLAGGPGGSCVCPNCDHQVPHAASQPCNAIACPKCGAKMTRAT